MNVVKNIAISLTESDVKQAIVDYLMVKGYKATLDDVECLVSCNFDGVSKGHFKGCRVNINDTNI